MHLFCSWLRNLQELLAVHTKDQDSLVSLQILYNLFSADSILLPLLPCCSSHPLVLCLLIVLYSVLTLCLVKRYVPSLECASPPSNLCHSWYTLWCNDEPCGRISPPPSASLTSLLRDPPHVRVPLTRLDTEWVLP